jgi:apolipoprotein N-acyltransferase
MAASKSRGKTKGKKGSEAPAQSAAGAAKPPAEPSVAHAPTNAAPTTAAPTNAAPSPTSQRGSWLERNGRGLVAAVVSGVLLGFSQPVVIESLGDEPIDPTGLTGVLALVGFVPVLLAMRGAGPKRAYWLGFVASFVQFTITVQWLVVAMVVFGRIPLLASWLILSLLTAGMSAYVAAAYAVTRMIAGRVWWGGRRVPMWIAFPVCLCATELLRNYGPLGGFPWGNVGMSFATVPLFLQAASLVGVYGLVFLAALASSTLAEFVAWRWDPLRTRAKEAESARGGSVAVPARDVERRAPMPRRPVLVGAAVLGGWVLFGAVRLATYDVGDAHVVKVALLQGNIEQGIRNDEAWTGRSILSRYHELTDEALAQGAQLFVWPEAAFPLRLRRDVKSMLEQRLVRDDGAAPAAAVVGAVGYEPIVVDGKRKEVRSNSAFIVGENFEVKGRVDKTHLVPFGEYVPWPLGAIVRQIVPIGGTEPGDSYESFPLSLADAKTGAKRDVRVGATICYEGIFPEISRSLKDAGTELHVNVTNDGWYGISGAATQHLLFYAMRAVESGTPVVRAANTGKSGWADNRGRLHDVTPIYVDRAVVADVPIANTSTLYAALGEVLALPCALLALLGWFASMLGLDVARRRRAALDLALGVIGTLVAVGGTVVYFANHDFDESRATRFLLLVLAGLLVGFGALSGRPWGRKAQMVTGLLALVFCVAAAGLGGAAVFLVVAAVGLALFVVQLLRKEAYQRAADPLVLDDA